MTSSSHPLADAWSLYAHPLADASTYRAAYTLLGTVTTCEEWGALWQHVPGADSFAKHDVGVMLRKQRIVALSFFRGATKPEWEHPDNHGGTTLTTRTTLPPDRARDVWTSLVADCARGAVEDGLLGVQVSQKWGRHAPSLKFDLWLHATCDAARVSALAHASTGGLCFTIAPRDRGPPPATHASRRRG